MARGGLDLAVYHPPYAIELDHEGRFVGVVMMFRRVEAADISPTTLALVKSLRPFLLNMLSSAGLRERFARPATSVRTGVSLCLRDSLRLSVVDRAILTLLLTGYSYKQAAAMMGVTLDTVKKHMKKVYSRAGVGSLPELWTKYYPTRWDNAGAASAT